jgi:type II secretory pathway pseudopilin PulG
VKPSRCRDIDVALRARAFTIVEAVISLIVVGALLVAALTTVGASRLSQHTTSKYGRGQLLAESLMAEILLQDYQDSDHKGVLGCETGETTNTREDFDDVDDYAAWSASPPVAKDGTAIAGFAGYTREVAVEWVVPKEPAQGESSETNAKRVVVTVRCNNAQVASLTALRTASGI